MTITAYDFKQIDNNSYGNPRYVVHFLNIPVNSDLELNQKYNEALYMTKKLGGKKYHNKSYGGGIVFCTYNLDKLINQLNELKA